MKKNVLFILLTIVVSFVLVSCNKDDEPSGLTEQYVCQHIAGTWESNGTVLTFSAPDTYEKDGSGVYAKGKYTISWAENGSESSGKWYHEPTDSEWDEAHGRSGIEFSFESNQSSKDKMNYLEFRVTKLTNSTMTTILYNSGDDEGETWVWTKVNK